jgi:hypothetical protein
MTWRRRQVPRPAAREAVTAEEGLAAECEAFLAGAYPAWLAAQGMKIPAWAWLNPVAHGTDTDLTALASHRRATPVMELEWSDVVAALAAELIAGGDILCRQQHVLVPLELQLVAGTQRAGSPAALLKAAQAALWTDPSHQ